MVGANRAESTDQWTAENWNYDEDSTIFLFKVSTSWFRYEELVDDWLDLTVLVAGKWPALRNRLVGNAEMYKGLQARTSEIR